jgi:hypothetical protein
MYISKNLDDLTSKRNPSAGYKRTGDGNSSPIRDSYAPEAVRQRSPVVHRHLDNSRVSESGFRDKTLISVGSQPT